MVLNNQERQRICRYARRRWLIVQSLTAGIGIILTGILALTLPLLRCSTRILARIAELDAGTAQCNSGDLGGTNTPHLS